MKNIFLFAIILFSYVSNCYSQNWLWARNGKSSGNTGEGGDKVNSVSTDVSGNVFVTGTFRSPTLTFGSPTLTKADSTNKCWWCSTNVSIAKYDMNGNVLWAKSAGGAGDDEGHSISADANGNVVITGWFSSPTITFGSTTLINNTQSDDIFIAKYDANGNVLWAKSAGGTNWDDGYSVATDVSGNVFITGVFWDSSLTFGSTTLPYIGSGDIFIAKYDAGGNMLWAKSAGGTGDDEGRSISTDPSGNVFVSGYFRSPTITFGSITLTNVAAYTNDIFIAKYDGSGNALWAKNVGGIPSQYGGAGYSLSADASGSVFVTGNFSSPTITFDSITLTNAESSGDYSDVFIAKYDASGNVLWAKRAGGTNTDVGYSVSVDLSGNVFVTGNFSGSNITFGSYTFTSPVGYNYPLFIVKYDGNGNVLCGSTLASNMGNGISVDSFGNAYVCGDFGANPFAVGADTLLPTCGYNIFVAKYRCDNNLPCIITNSTLNDTACNSYTLNGTTYNSSGTYTQTLMNTVSCDSIITLNLTINSISTCLNINTTGINEIKNINQLVIFPNPSNGAFTIESTSEGNYSIINELGETMQELKLNSTNQYTMNIENLNAGIYFIVGGNNKETTHQKIVVTK